MQRRRTIVVRVDDRELAQVHALSDDLGEPATVVIRALVKRAYKSRFGEVDPPRRARATKHEHEGADE